MDGDIFVADHQESSITNANFKYVILTSIYLPQIHFHSQSLFSSIKDTDCRNPGILFAANQARQLAWSTTLNEDLSELAYRTLFYQDQVTKLDKATRLTIRRVIWILASGTLSSSLTCVGNASLTFLDIFSEFSLTSHKVSLDIHPR